MNNDILGNIKRDDEHGSDGVSTIRYASRDIEVRMNKDDQSFETTLELAANVVSRLGELDKAAKRIAVVDLRGTYNSGWNVYDQVQDDGSRKTVSNRQLSEAEFEKKLFLKAVDVTGDQVIVFFYDDSGMFWGHCVLVTSLKGIDLSEAYAELFG